MISVNEADGPSALCGVACYEEGRIAVETH